MELNTFNRMKMQLILQLKSYKLQLMAIYPTETELEINQRMLADDQINEIMRACGVKQV